MGNKSRHNYPTKDSKPRPLPEDDRNLFRAIAAGKRRRNAPTGDSNPAKRFPMANVTRPGSALSHQQRRGATA